MCRTDVDCDLQVESEKDGGTPGDTDTVEQVAEVGYDLEGDTNAFDLKLVLGD